VSKSLFASKTFWFNAAALVALSMQWALDHHWIAPIDSAFIVGVVNIGLRMVTTQPVTLPGAKTDA